MLRRRFFLTSLAATVAPTATMTAADASPNNPAMHLVGRVASAPDLKTPSNQNEPFGWQVRFIAESKRPPVMLRFPELDDQTATRLRFTIGLDQRSEQTVEVAVADTGRVLGTIRVRYAGILQPYSLDLKSSDLADIRRAGIRLRLTQGKPLAIFSGDTSPTSPPIPDVLCPHLLVPGQTDPMDEYYRRLNSLGSVAQFGWMSGCVLDGLLDLGHAGHPELLASAQRHLDVYFQGDDLKFLGTRSQPIANRIPGIESSLPFAALARLHPDHPKINLALEFWKNRTQPSGSVQDGHHMSSEGSYTVGYPMAEIARVRNEESLMRKALDQTIIRHKTLFDGKQFHRTFQKGRRGNRNWARGIAWQMLGMARTMQVAQSMVDVHEAASAFRAITTFALSQQRDDGLWSVFTDETNLTADTSGSAGIAAAMAIGVSQGWLDEAAGTAADATLSTLKTHLTTDGFLKGVAQANKGGESLQRGNYRVIGQFAMGLLAQLIAATDV